MGQLPSAIAAANGAAAVHAEAHGPVAEARREHGWGVRGGDTFGYKYVRFNTSHPCPDQILRTVL